MSFTAFMIVLLCCLGVIVVSLWFIRHQLKLNKAREEKIRAGEERFNEERQKRIDSIRVLLKAAGTEELNWIEASIRIKHLLDQLSEDFSEHEDISAFYIINEKTQHIPTHSQWSELPKPARMKFRSEMESYESEHADQLQKARLALLEYDFK
ncbi:DUF2489 domain-containing protein [Marinomonas sp. CT5]|uniref:DUF2489 domain-containing protein n=1 Tax=Marinomonas sp. CT5 TaxID=2066133 RepID=UPI0017F4EAD2|nr:DUF2489 domain-containing protein [Marinomonas sp. CT5]NVK72519.1 DUF2489 domain-containing protein [Oceanospirillaceae bacterium]QUX97132.1 DUF2489 domain-containing protein [Marinomonas sp. CT5]